MTKVDKFWEELPSSCPPAEAIDSELGPVFRLVKASPPSNDCFASKAALGKQKPFKKSVDDCSWASCSMWAKKSAVEGILKLGHVRRQYTHVATMHFPEGAGKHLVKGDHVDFWCYADFEIHNAINDVEAL